MFGTLHKIRNNGVIDFKYISTPFISEEIFLTTFSSLSLLCILSNHIRGIEEIYLSLTMKEILSYQIQAFNKIHVLHT